MRDEPYLLCIIVGGGFIGLRRPTQYRSPAPARDCAGAGSAATPPSALPATTRTAMCRTTPPTSPLARCPSARPGARAPSRPHRGATPSALPSVSTSTLVAVGLAVRGHAWMGDGSLLLTARDLGRLGADLNACTTTFRLEDRLALRAGVPRVAGLPPRRVPPRRPHGGRGIDAVRVLRLGRRRHVPDGAGGLAQAAGGLGSGRLGFGLALGLRGIDADLGVMLRRHHRCSWLGKAIEAVGACEQRDVEGILVKLTSPLWPAAA